MCELRNKLKKYLVHTGKRDQKLIASFLGVLTEFYGPKALNKSKILASNFKTGMHMQISLTNCVPTDNELS